MQRLAWACEAIGWLVGLAMVVWFSGQLAHYRYRTIQETDTRGYIEIAKALARCELPRWRDEFSRFRSHCWVEPSAHGPESADSAAAAAAAPVSESAAPEAQPWVMSKYSPGWPLCLVPGYWLGGEHGALWVNPILAMLGVLAFFLLARDLFGAVAAAICTFVWVTSPMLLMYANYPLGHGPEIAFTVFAAAALVRWAKTGRARWALAAGFCAGFLPLIRPTTVLLWPGLALLYVVVRHGARAAASEPAASRGRWRLVRPTWPIVRPWLAASLGAAIPILFVLWYNHALYGNVFRTGYYFTDEQKAFDLDWLVPGTNARVGSTWSGGQGGRWLDWRWQSFFGEREFMLENRFALLVLLALVLRLSSPGLAAAFLLWCVPTFLLYMSYYFFTGGPVFYRFLLSCLPAAVLSIGFLGGGWVRKAWPVQLLLLAGFGLWIWHTPPRYFTRRAQVAQHEDLDRTKFPLYSFQLRDPLTQAFSLAHMPSRTLDLEPWIVPHPCAVYARSWRQWEVAMYPTVTAYDLDAWTDPRVFQPFAQGPRNAHNQQEWGVWGDGARVRSEQARMQAIGQAALPDLFRRQVERHLQAGRPVYILVDSGHAVLDWARATPAWTVEKVYDRPAQEDSTHRGLGPLQLWQVRLRT